MSRPFLDFAIRNFTLRHCLNSICIALYGLPVRSCKDWIYQDTTCVNLSAEKAAAFALHPKMDTTKAVVLSYLGKNKKVAIPQNKSESDFDYLRERAIVMFDFKTESHVMLDIVFQESTLK